MKCSHKYKQDTTLQVSKTTLTPQKRARATDRQLLKTQPNRPYTQYVLLILNYCDFARRDNSPDISSKVPQQTSKMADLKKVAMACICLAYELILVCTAITNTNGLGGNRGGGQGPCQGNMPTSSETRTNN